VDRTLLAVLCDAYEEEPGDKETRVVLHINQEIAPVKVAILPLSRNEKLGPVSKEISAMLRPHFMTQYVDAQSIGRRYRRQDEIGTPWCVTIDFDTIEKPGDTFTLRERDSMTQIRITETELFALLEEKVY
jgi:glycyl-tRNA synthetase